MSEKRDKPTVEVKKEENKLETTLVAEKTTSTLSDSKKQEEKPSIKQIEFKEEIVSVIIEAQNEKFTVTLNTKSRASTISETIDRLIQEITKSKSFPLETIVKKEKPATQTTPKIESDNKMELFAKRFDVDADKLIKSDLIGIKNDDVQIIRSTKFAPSEVGLLILSMKDHGLGQKSVPYEEWKVICEATGIKSKTPWYQVATNYSNLNQIEKNKYKNSKMMVITLKGEKIVKKALERALNS